MGGLLQIRCTQGILWKACFTITLLWITWQPHHRPPRVACLALPLIHSQSGAGKPVILCLLALTAAGRDQKFALTKLSKSSSLSGPPRAGLRSARGGWSSPWGSVRAVEPWRESLPLSTRQFFLNRTIITPSEVVTTEIWPRTPQSFIKWFFWWLSTGKRGSSASRPAGSCTSFSGALCCWAGAAGEPMASSARELSPLCRSPETGSSSYRPAARWRDSRQWRCVSQYMQLKLLIQIQNEVFWTQLGHPWKDKSHMQYV